MQLHSVKASFQCVARSLRVLRDYAADFRRLQRPGISWACSPCESVHIFPAARMADGTTGGSWVTRLAECAMRPTCINCRKMCPPLACTAFVTPRYALICSGEYIDGVRA